MSDEEKKPLETLIAEALGTATGDVANYWTSEAHTVAEALKKHGLIRTPETQPEKKPDQLFSTDAPTSGVPREEQSVARLRHLENGLDWIRMYASLHYFGGAFDPEHMRNLANLATDTINGKPLPNFQESLEHAQQAADEWMATYVEDKEEAEDA